MQCRLSSCWILGLALGLSGCGGDATDSPDPVAGPGATPGQPTPGQPTPGPTPPAGPDAATDTRLLPLGAGRTWTYHYERLGGSVYCATGDYEMRTLSAAAVGGRSGYKVTSFCPSMPASVLSNDGDKVLSYWQGQWGTLLDAPVQAGHAWTFFNASYVWEGVPSITVPAGTFANCWKARQRATYPAHQIYCHGIGMVESHMVDLAGNGWHVTLTSKNF